MSRKLMYASMAVMVGALASTTLADSVVVSSFEAGLGGWYTDTWVVGQISLSPTGATAGTQAMLVEGPGGWQHLTKVSVKPYRTQLANRGVKVSADFTAFAADMTTTWMQVQMIINAQGDNNNGVNNNVGWHELGLQDLPRDGQPHTLSWVVPDAVAAKIGAADDNIGWLEIQLQSNTEGTSTVKFYVDNVQISWEPPSSSIIIGNFENGQLDGWSKAWETTPVVLANATTGATSGTGSLSLTTTDGYWCLQWNAPTIPASLARQKLQFDLTMIAAEWPVGRWTKVGDKIAINSNGASGWKEYTTATAVDQATGQATGLDWGRWSDTAPDVVKTYSLDVSDYDVTGATWFQIIISVQGGDGLAHFYFDNIRLVAPKSTSKSTDTVIGNWEQVMDGWVAGATADIDIRFNDVNGVTLDKYSLDIYHPSLGWQEVLKLNAVEANLVDAIRKNQQISVDVTRLVADWPKDTTPGWGGLHMAFNCGGDGWSLWQEFGYAGNWVPSNGDQTQTVVWSYARYLPQINFDKVGWFEILFFSNYDPDNYKGWVLLYLDNMKLIGGGRGLNPRPADAAKDVDTETLLRWDAGMFAKSHNVYLGTSVAGVQGADENSTAGVTFAKVDSASFDPNALAFNTRYFWRVDEANDANPDSPWKGPVWSFTTANFIVVDQFEQYTDDTDANQAIYQTWADGWTNEALGGSLVGYTNPPYAEQTIVHAGKQALPLQYDNSDKSYSETKRTWATPQDWTRNGYNTLKLYIQGKPGNGVDPLYVKVEDSAGQSTAVTYPDTKIMTAETWTEWQIPLATLTGANVDVKAITGLTIGVGKAGAASGATGVLYIDDIQVGAKPMDLVAYYSLDGDLKDRSGNGFDGTLAGDPNFPASYVNGPAGHGKGMLFEGTSGHQYVALGTFNPSAATDKLSVSLWAKWDGLSQAWQGLIGKRGGSWSANAMMWQIEANLNDGALRFQREGTGDIQLANSLPIGQWTHIAVTFDGTTARGYINGTETVSGNFSFGYDTQAPIQFGADTDGGGNAFNGALDEIRIYDRVLTPAEIQALAK